MKVTLDSALKRFVANPTKPIVDAEKTAFSRLVMKAESIAKRIIYKGPPDHLHADTGRSRQSITHEVSWPYGVVGSPLVQMAAHEFGATITPKRGKNLAIPIGNRKGSPRQYADLDFIIAGGTKLLVDQAGNAQYVLKPRVVLKPRPTFQPALDQTMTALPDMFNAALDGTMP